MDIKILISISGPNFKEWLFWDTVRQKIHEKISELFDYQKTTPAKITLVGVTLSVDDAKIIAADGGNVMFSVKQDDVSFYPNEVRTIIREVLKENLPPTAKLTNS